MREQGRVCVVCLSSWMPCSCRIECHCWFKTCCLKHMNVLSVVLQLTASNMEGKSCPSEVLVCTTSPDRPGPPTRPLIKGPVMSHGFSVKWGMFYCYCCCCLFWQIFFLNLINFSSDKPVNKETYYLREFYMFEIHILEISWQCHQLVKLTVVRAFHLLHDFPVRHFFHLQFNILMICMW